MLKVNEFWWAGRQLYRIIATNPLGHATKVSIIRSPHPDIVGDSFVHSASGWSANAFDRRDDFITEVYKQRNEEKEDG